VAASALLVWNVDREGTTTRVGPSPQPSPTRGRERTAVVEIATLQLKPEDEIILLPACEKMPLARLETLR
jgi:hypothetical protein